MTTPSTITLRNFHSVLVCNQGDIPHSDPVGLGDSLNAYLEEGGGVVLAHDFDRENDATDPDSHADYVIELTRRVIAFAEENGYRIVRLGDILQAGRA